MLTDDYLNRMREVGDETADETITRLFHSGDTDAVNRMMRHLVNNDQIQSGDFSQLPQEIADYLMIMDQVPLPDAEATRIAQRVFADHGPEILMVLGFYSLPASYAAAKGVQVLDRTAKLVRGPLRRVFETTQMVIDVAIPGGLGKGGRGLATVRKVRLMHAAVRHLLQADPRTPWDRSFGKPINQEDLAGTMTTFSYLIVEGLTKLEAELSAEQREAWLVFWGGVARMLGLLDALIPDTLDGFETLTRVIQRRQIHPTAEGRQLTAALIGMYDEIIPGTLFDGFAPTLMREFLPEDVADGLGIPKADFTEWIWKATGAALHCKLTEGPIRTLIRRFNMAFLAAMRAQERAGERPPFDIPDDLADGWRESKS